MSDSERERSPARERSPPRERSIEPKDAPKEETKEEFKSFVGGIPWQFDDERLREVFAEFNPISASVMLDKITRRSRGFGFVWFGSEHDRQRAIDMIHDSDIEGRRISVTKAIPQSQTAPGTPADKLRLGQTVPRDRGPVRRGGGYGRDRDRDRGDRYGGGGRRDDYRRDDYYRRDYGRDRYYDGGYDRGYGGGGGGGSYRPGYGYSSGGGDRYSSSRYSSYDRRDAPPHNSYGGSDYYNYAPPADRDPYGAPPVAGSYERPPVYGNYNAPPPAADAYGAERYSRDARPGPYDRPPPRSSY